MNEIFYYAGMVFAIASFAVAILLFFILKIPEAVGYYISPDSHRRKRKGKKAKPRKMKMEKSKPKKEPKRKPPIKITEGTELLTQGATEVLHTDEATEILHSMKDKTELLSIAQNYATAILDADQATEILTEWDSITETISK